MASMDRETSSAWPGSIDEVTFTFFTMFLYVILDVIVMMTMMGRHLYNDRLPALMDSRQIPGVILFSWGAGWFGAVMRMNGICGRRPYMFRDVADNEALKSIALGAILQLPLFVLMIALIRP
ncbi:MAG TPA: hypothetical protein VGJ92_12940 [Methanocella sp.]|jgi:hypothetical protein